MKIRFLVGLSVLGLAACQGTETTTPNQPLPPSLAILDGAHLAGNPDFFFLPPLVWPTSSLEHWTRDGFNPSLSPSVEICPITVAGGSCTVGPPLVVISGADVKKHFPPVADPSDLITGLPGDWAHYHAKWKLPNSCPVPALYRVAVKVGAVLLGYSDVKCVSKFSDLLKVDYKKFGAGLRGTTLQIPFRIERYALCPNPLTGPCGTASIPFAAGGEVVFKDTEGNVAGLVQIPEQVADPRTVTVTVAPCTDPAGLPVDLPVDLPIFGNCIKVTTDPVGVELSPTALASVYVCHAAEDPALDLLVVAQRRRVTLHRQSDDLSELQALPHTDVDGCLDVVSGAVDPSIKGLLRSLVQRDWKRARGQFFGLVAPKPLYARRLDVGAGGRTRGFSNFQLALPCALEKTVGDDQVGLPGAALGVRPKVRCVDVGGDGVAGAKVHFTPGPGSGSSGEAMVPTDEGGYAETTTDWTLGGSPGAQTLKASGYGLAGTDNNGPRGGVAEVDPFQPIQPPFDEVDALPVPPATPLAEGTVTFNATGFDGPVNGFDFQSGGYRYLANVENDSHITWFGDARDSESYLQPGETSVPAEWYLPGFSPTGWGTGQAAFGAHEPENNACPDLSLQVHTAWALNTDILVRKKFWKTSPGNINITVYADNDVQIWLDGFNISAMARAAARVGDHSNGVELGGAGADDDWFVHGFCADLDPPVITIHVAAGEHTLALRGDDYGVQSHLDAKITVVP